MFPPKPFDTVPLEVDAQRVYLDAFRFFLEKKKSHATLEAMAPTNNIKTVLHQTSLLHIIESNLDRLGLLKNLNAAKNPPEQSRGLFSRWWEDYITLDYWM